MDTSRSRYDKQDVTLTDAEFDEELERIRDSRSTMEPVTEARGLANGDFAEISFTGQVQPIRRSRSERTRRLRDDAEPVVGHDVLIEIGGKNTLESFSAALNGATPGQELKFEVSYPPEFGERKLAGKTVAYDVQVKSIKKKDRARTERRIRQRAGSLRKLCRLRAETARSLGQRQAPPAGERNQVPVGGDAGRKVRFSGAGVIGAAADRYPARPRAACPRRARYAHGRYA